MPAPEISAFGDGSHEAGTAGIDIDGGGFGAFAGSAWIYASQDRTGNADELTVNSWNDIQINVDIPGSLNNLSGTRYLFVQREDLAWSQGFEFELGATLPTFSSASIPEAGTSITVNFSEAVSQGAGYSDGDWTVTASGGAVTLTYSSGDTTNTHVFTTSRTIEAGETVTLGWAGTANGLEDSAGNDLATFSGEVVSISSGNLRRKMVRPTELKLVHPVARKAGQ